MLCFGWNYCVSFAAWTIHPGFTGWEWRPPPLTSLAEVPSTYMCI